MQEEQTESREKKPEIPEDDGTTEGVDDPSLDEEEPELGEEQPAAELEQVPSDEDQEEDEPAEEEEELLEEEPPQRRGCLTGCVIPIAAIFVVLLVMVMIGYSKRDVITKWLLKRTVANTQNHVLSDPPADMDKNQIENAFQEVTLAMKEGRVDEEALAEAIEEYQYTVIRGRPSTEEKKQAINKLMTALSAAIIRVER